LNHSAASGVIEYTAYIDSNPVAICMWIAFPYPGRKIKRCHRLVVLPDYQGIGISRALKNATAKETRKSCDMVTITTSLKGYSKGLMKDSRWVLIRAGRTSENSNIKSLNKMISKNRNTYSFMYKGE
jgi:GNAT superfamily N-acetyltransferase